MKKIDFKTLVQENSFDGIACLFNANIAQTKTGNDYVSGTFIDGSTRTLFKIWDTTAVNAVKNLLASPAGFKPMLVHVTGKVGVYNNALDYTVASISTDIAELSSGELSVLDFLPSLDCDKLFADLCNFINTELSPAYIQALMLIMNIQKGTFQSDACPDSSKRLIDMLKTAWAASGYHDAITGGLMNHTLKMLNIAKAVVANNAFFAIPENKNLLYAGIILHDIGKIQEIQDGCYSKNSFVSHRVIGIEFLAEHKAEIASLIGIDAYYRLLSVIIGHHDKFGTPADTVWAYLVHLIDMLDAWSTIISETNATGTFQKSSCGDIYLMCNGTRLFY